MTAARWLNSVPLPLVILWLASWLAPGAQRAEFLSDWRAELWYVQQGRLLFCLGAFRDAFWLRRNDTAPDGARTSGLESPVRCLLFLALLAAVSVFFAFRLPMVRKMLLPSPYGDVRNLGLISAAGSGGPRRPSVPVERYLAWRSAMQGVLTGAAYYQPVPMRVPTTAGNEAALWVAVSSANLFELLQLSEPVIAPLIDSRAGARLVLGESAWKRYFNGDPNVVGRSLDISGQPVTIAGIVPAGYWHLPGQMDAWLLEAPADLAALLPAYAQGFVLARLKSASQEAFLRRSLATSAENLSDGRLDFALLQQADFASGLSMVLLLSLVVLVATTPLTLGEYPSNGHSIPGTTRSRRWIFLTVKIALLLPIVFFGALDLGSLISISFQAHGLIFGPILAIRWALNDQRNRCPVCLRTLGRPTRIGGPAQTFLEWYGAELICAHGHGLLYVPEIPNSCYNTQRWQYLDPSWSSLFS